MFLADKNDMRWLALAFKLIWHLIIKKNLLKYFNLQVNTESLIRPACWSPTKPAKNRLPASLRRTPTQTAARRRLRHGAGPALCGHGQSAVLTAAADQLPQLCPPSCHRPQRMEWSEEPTVSDQMISKMLFFIDFFFNNGNNVCIMIHT